MKYLVAILLLIASTASAQERPTIEQIILNAQYIWCTGKFSYEKDTAKANRMQKYIQVTYKRRYTRDWQQRLARFQQRVAGVVRFKKRYPNVDDQTNCTTIFEQVDSDLDELLKGGTLIYQQQVYPK